MEVSWEEGGGLLFKALSVTLHGRVAYIRWKEPLIVVPSWASHKPTDHEGVRNFTIVGVRNVTSEQNSIFRNWEVILSRGLVFVIF